MDIISRQYALANELTEYYTGKPCKYGHIALRTLKSGHCIPCKAARVQRWRESNRDKDRAMRRARYKRDSKHVKAQNKKWTDNNRGIVNAKNAKWRKQAKLATPLWVDHSEILIKYKLAAWCSKNLGETYHVDHVIPLQGKNVCGLHIAENLRVITAKENCSKNNKWEANNGRLI